MSRPRNGWLLAKALVVAVGLAVGLAVGCTSSPAFDRDAAIRTVVRDDPRLTLGQAGCYVDHVVNEMGVGALGPGIPTEQIARRTSMRIDCIGVANLGTAPSGTLPRRDEEAAANVPLKIGDDATLDALAASCTAGDGPACDALFEASPLASEYEDLASTCGGRTRETTCADRYPATTVPTAAPKR